MRNPLLTRFACCWLAALVLLGSMGFSTVDHWCQMRGHTKSLLLTGKNCTNICSADLPDPSPVSNAPTVKRSPCCKTTLSYQHIDTSRLLTDQHTPTGPVPIDYWLASSFAWLLPVSVSDTAAVNFASLPADDPLIRSGRSRLIASCIWLI